MKSRLLTATLLALAVGTVVAVADVPNGYYNTLNSYFGRLGCSEVCGVTYMPEIMADVSAR